MMAGGGHADEIDVEFDGRIDDRVHDVARPQNNRRQRRAIKRFGREWRNRIADVQKMHSGVFTADQAQ